LSLDRAADTVVWEYARAEGFLLVTKDADFSELSTLRGFPPKVIWLCLGNCTASQIEALLRRHFDAVQNLVDNDAVGILTLR
jgi:predicted nuclease of predicted toxin-antitoxin system